MERQNIPRRAEEERQCKRAQIQHKTTQRTEHLETYGGISAKTRPILIRYTLLGKRKEKHIYKENSTRMII
jgi:hypothetical protein